MNVGSPSPSRSSSSLRHDLVNLEQAIIGLLELAKKVDVGHKDILGKIREKIGEFANEALQENLHLGRGLWELCREIRCADLSLESERENIITKLRHLRSTRLKEDTARPN